MKINTNIASMNALRNTSKAQSKVAKSIEKMSSGEQLNRGADGPAQLYAATVLKNQVTGLKQTQTNGENSISMIQVAEGALGDASNLINKLRQLAVHAANEAVNDESIVIADQMEAEQLLQNIDRMAQNTTFGSIRLLDGSMGVNGSAVGDGFLTYVSAESDTKASPEEGFAVDIKQIATRARKEGVTPLTVENIGDGFKLLIGEGGKFAEMNTGVGSLKTEIEQIKKNFNRDPEQYTKEQMSKDIRSLVVHSMNKVIEGSNINVEMFERPDNIFVFRHKEFGDKPEFAITGNIPGVITSVPEQVEYSEEGRNVEGTISGYSAIGEGQFLTSREGSPASGLTVRYEKILDYYPTPVFDEHGTQVSTKFNLAPQGPATAAKTEGFIHVSQQSREFQLDSNQGLFEKYSFLDMNSNRLGRGVDNDSEILSLSDIDFSTAESARDSLKVIDKAAGEISETRADMGTFQKHTLESTINTLGNVTENLTLGESILRDADIAQEFSKMTKDQIMLQASQSMLAQANQRPQSVMNLIS